MPISTVAAGATFAAGLNATFRNTYKLAYTAFERFVSMFFAEIPSDRLTEPYAYYESAPYPRRWPRGQDRGTSGFRAVSYSVTNKDWEVGVGWHQNDRRYDQLRDLENQARMAASHWATLPLRILAQIQEATTNYDLLEAIPSAPDGSALYVGTARFGNAAGNIVTGSGVLNAGVVRHDYHAVLQRFTSFLDTQGQPLIDPGIIGQGVLIEYPPPLIEVMRETFLQGQTITQITATGATNLAAANVAVAGTSNVILEAGDRIMLWCNPFLTDVDDWYATLLAAPLKPLVRQISKPIEEHFETMENSDHARRSGEESVWWDTSEGYGVNLPYTTLRVSNT